MFELKFIPINDYVNPKGTETDNTKYVVKMLPKKNGRLYVMTGTEIMTDMAHGQFIYEIAKLSKE